MTLRKLLPLAILAVPVVLFGLACGDEDIDRIDSPSAIATSAVDEREQFVQEARARLDEIDDRIQELDDARGMEQQGGNASDTIDDRLDELKQRRNDLEDRLDALVDMNARDWDNARDDIEDELTELLDDLNRM